MWCPLTLLCAFLPWHLNLILCVHVSDVRHGGRAAGCWQWPWQWQWQWQLAVGCFASASDLSTDQAPRQPQRASRATTSQPGLARSNIKFTGTSNLGPPHSHACSSDHQHTSTQATSICLGDASSCLREPRRLLDRQWSVAVVPQKYRRHHPSSTTGNEREEKKNIHKIEIEPS